MTVNARWESRGQKYWVEVRTEDDGTFSFRAPGSGGIGYPTLEDALKRGELETTFMPSKMKRVL